MRNAEKTKIKDFFFQLKEIRDSFPRTQKDIINSLRFLNIVNSNSLENKIISRDILQVALYRGNARVKNHFSPVYRKAFLEVLGQDQLFRNLEKLAAQKTELSVSLLLEMHRMMFEKSWPDIAGRYRDIDVRIRGIKHRPPYFSQLSGLMYQHLAWIDGLLKLLGPATQNNFFEIFHVSADVQFRIIQTYPFRAGNWRIARSLSDYILLYCGLFYNVIDCDKRDEYLKAVGESKITDFSPLEDFLLKCFGETLNRISGFLYLIKQGEP